MNANSMKFNHLRAFSLEFKGRDYYVLYNYEIVSKAMILSLICMYQEKLFGGHNFDGFYIFEDLSSLGRLRDKGTGDECDFSLWEDDDDIVY